MARIDLDTNDLPDPDTIEPVPAGRYICEIIESDVANTKSGNGESLNLTLQVIEGEFTGRKIWDRLNYRHSDETAQRIGQQAVKAICRAVGFEGLLEDSAALHGLPLMVRVVIEDKDPQYRPRNIVKGYEAAAGYGGAPQGQQQQRPAAAAQPAQPSRGQTMAPARPQAGNKPAPSFMTRR